MSLLGVFIIDHDGDLTRIIKGYQHLVSSLLNPRDISMLALTDITRIIKGSQHLVSYLLNPRDISMEALTNVTSFTLFLIS